MNALELKQIQVHIGDKTVIERISLSVEQGEIICLLGPSGCGKTTLLRTIAGFQAHEQGEVLINGEKYSDTSGSIAVEKRKLGMVFQDFALFPHLSVRENICFGIQGRNRQAQQQKLNELTNLLSMSGFIDSYPHELSGGQQQRVAIARAMAPEPDLLLLDEPFSSMDVELREQLARNMRQVLKEADMTVIMVSHNQREAFAMADRIGLISDGRLLQLDSAFNLYHRPENNFVARFIGEGNFIEGKIISTDQVETRLGSFTTENGQSFSVGSEVLVLIRPDDVIHDDDSKITALVVDKIFRGAEFLYTLELDNGERILSLVPSHHNHPVNAPIGIRFELDHLVLFPKQ